jgi:hypothetical protein
MILICIAYNIGMSRGRHYKGAIAASRVRLLAAHENCGVFLADFIAFSGGPKVPAVYQKDHELTSLLAYAHLQNSIGEGHQLDCKLSVCQLM